ncbi:MAG TPA: hypothetical protein VJ302_38210 [Blastocatellia bacterium]|nr:hypothetical protein [Blastocatellia bacterium]
MKVWLIIGVLIGGLLSASPVINAQEDPNAQYIIIRSGALSAQPLEIEMPIEVSVLKLQLAIEFKGDLTLSVITPFGKPLDLNDQSIHLFEAKEKRTVLIWDPRPGVWKLRLSGSGSFTATALVQSEVYVCCLQFFGRNGAYMMDRFQPSRTTYQQAQVYASGFNLDTIEFQMINEQGEVISPIKFRQSDLSNPSGFTLLINTPDQPFRVLARGRDTNGQSFQRVFHWLIKPHATEPSTVPPESPVVAGANQVPPELDREASEGEQKIVRAWIVKWSDEPLISEKGNQIGIRLYYSIRFPVKGSYSPYPQLYPERLGSIYTGALSMRVHKVSVEPWPENLDNPTQLAFGARATFSQRPTYNFTIDLVPNYTVYNEQKGFCLQSKAYNQPSLRERFEREVTSEQKLRFRFSVPGTDIDGRLPTLTENTYIPNVWRLGYLKEGAKDCQ